MRRAPLLQSWWNSSSFGYEGTNAEKHDVHESDLGVLNGRFPDVCLGPPAVWRVQSFSQRSICSEEEEA